MNDTKFLIELIKFYKDTLVNSSKSIKGLAELQKKFPKNYEGIKKITTDPTQLTKTLELLDDEPRGILVDIYMKQDMFSKKGIMLFQMDVKQKLAYAKELEDFGKYVDKKILKLVKIIETKKKKNKK